MLRHALQNQQAGASQTCVTLAGEAPERMTRGLARHPIPIILLARLAIAATWQGKGLGGGLLKDTLLRTLQAAGIQAFAVHAKGDQARSRLSLPPAQRHPRRHEVTYEREGHCSGDSDRPR
ncbi:MAG: hypothetical protein NTY38_04305 [Acidobacteria bacterium]|nr:hypothetical protein [Acidobacteriota bacterium]